MMVDFLKIISEISIIELLFTLQSANNNQSIITVMRHFRLSDWFRFVYFSDYVAKIHGIQQNSNLI